MTKFTLLVAALLSFSSMQAHAQTASVPDLNSQQSIRDAKIAKERPAQSKSAADKKTNAGAVPEKTDAELQAMSRKERKDYMKAQQKKHADALKASTGVSVEELGKATPAQRKEIVDKLSK